MIIGVVTVSDRCFMGEAEDRSGPTIVDLLRSKLDSTARFYTEVVPDELERIRAIIKRFADEMQCSLIVTTGGTGFSHRDVTPEAVRPLLTKEAPGIVHAMMSYSLQQTPVAWLSRPVGGVRGSSVIVTVPGSSKAALECLTPLVEHGLQHAITLAGGELRDPHPAEASANRSSAISQAPAVAPDANAQSTVASRPRKSEFPMVSMAESLEIIISTAAAAPKNVVQLPAMQCLGYVLAEDVTSGFNHPPFRASIKDGYAVVAADGPGVYHVAGSLIAGAHPEGFALSPGTVCRVNTGGPVPPGADAVVQVEDTELVRASVGGEEELVKILSSVKPGHDIRPIGCDLGVGGIAVPAGTLVDAPEIGLALSVGADRLRVFSPPRVAVVSTGDELVDRTSLGSATAGPPPPGKIYDSNRSMLLAACVAEGVPVLDGGIAADNMASTRDVILAALQHSDIVVSSGGVSMGEVDCVKKVLLELGATIHFGRVNMKPGKPTTFAQLRHDGRERFYFGLPGNPVSAMVCFHLFVVPAIRALAAKPTKQPTVFATTASALRLDPERPEYHRCAVALNEDGELIARSTGIQASHRLLSLSGANGLMVLPPASEERRELPLGSRVQVILIGRL